MKKKAKRFDEGGLSQAQQDWLGGADRNDPIIMARMRAAVPDAPAATPDVTDVAPPKAVERTVVKTKVTPAKRITGDDTINPDVKMRSDNVKKLKDVVSLSAPKSFREAGGNMKPTRSNADVGSFKIGIPDPLARYDNKNWSMKKGGFVSHNDHVKQHSAGFKHHDDHVKAMCGGGMAKKKK
jgi:hypothetical protein